MHKVWPVALLCLGLVACGGGGSSVSNGAPPSTNPGGTSPSGSAVTYTIGGTVRGLKLDSSLTLQTSAGNTVKIAKDGEFAFQSKISTGTAFNVTVAQNPVGLNCSVLGGSGVIAGADVLNIEVLCNAAAVTVSQRGTAVTTLAGIAGDPGQNDGTRGLATFSCPIGVTNDGGDGFYISDAEGKTVRHVTAQGTVATVAGLIRDSSGPYDGERGTATFGSPSGIARDAAGNLYVAEALVETVRVISPSGTVTTKARLGLGGGSLLLIGVAIDTSGNIFVVEQGAHVIVKISPDGGVSKFAGMENIPGSSDGARLAASFKYPFGVVMDGGGNLFVSDVGNHTIRKISPDGIVTTFAGAPGLAGADDGTGQSARFNHPAGIAADRLGNLYVVDHGNRTVRMITPAGVVSTLAGSPSVAATVDGYGAAAGFKDPWGIAVDVAGNLLVSDCADNTIRKLVLNQDAGTATLTPPQTVFPETAVVTTLAGKPDESGAVDGVGTDARFGAPGSIAIDGGGNVVVGDNWPNNLLRLVSPSGVVTTLAGTKGALNVTRDGFGAEASFTEFSSIAVDAAGNMYIPGIGTRGGITTGLRKVTPAGFVTTLDYSDPGRDGLSSIVADRIGNIYGTDGARIDKLSLSTMQITVLAGGSTPATSLDHSFDAPGRAARFNTPTGIVMDSAGNLFVADSWNLTIRKITPDGIVSTFAGKLGNPGDPPYYDSATVDGTGESARFDFPTAMAIDAADNLYVVDRNTVRKITPGRVVTTIAGLGGTSGFKDGIGAMARFRYLSAIAVDKAGTIYVVDGKTIRKIALR